MSESLGKLRKHYGEDGMRQLGLDEKLIEKHIPKITVRGRSKTKQVAEREARMRNASETPPRGVRRRILFGTEARKRPEGTGAESRPAKKSPVQQCDVQIRKLNIVKLTPEEKME